MQCVKKILDEFCLMSGQEISNEKSSMLFSENVSRSMRTKLTNMSGFRETNSLGKYLGVPLKGNTLRKDDFNYVID